MHWEAALVIAESAKGCMAVWADEPDLKYGRQLLLGRGKQSWTLGVEFETADAIYRCDEIKDAVWRFNVFKGYWVNAAERYRQQMMAQWGMKPLSEQTPAWADKVRVVTTTWDDVALLSKLVPRDSMVAFTTQGWLEGWNNGEMVKHGENYHPNFPLDNPVRWEGVKDSVQVFKKCEDLGIHVFPYTNGVVIETQKHPWISQKVGDRHFWAWPVWQRFYPELCKDIVARYGVSAIYEDCSWVHARHMFGEIDGDNWYNGSVKMREYFHEIMPQIALMGERNNEITARGQQFALGWIGPNPYTHPICAYLFEPFVRMYNLNSQAHAYDSEDVRGYTVTNWMELSNAANPMQEDLMIRKRGVVFATEQLGSHWPETWDPAVMHYFKGKDGAEYRFVRDHGTRFVKMSDGKPETIYWRVSGVPSVEAPGVGIEGWAAYDGDKVIGLNPARSFVLVDNAARPPVTLCALPGGYVVDRTVLRDGYLTMHLDTAEQAKALLPPDAPVATSKQSVQTLRVRAKGEVRFLGAEQVTPKGGGEYEVSVKLPGGFSACWAAPTTVPDGTVYLGEIPAAATLQRKATGVLCLRDGGLRMQRGEIVHNPGAALEAEGTVDWLLTLPAQPVRCAFKYGAAHGYGAGGDYVVRVNGVTLWKKYFNETADDPKDAQAHKPRPAIADTVDLSAYAGQTVVLELAEGGRFGGSDVMRWDAPRLEPVASSSK